MGNGGYAIPQQYDDISRKLFRKLSNASILKIEFYDVKVVFENNHVIERMIMMKRKLIDKNSYCSLFTILPGRQIKAGPNSGDTSLIFSCVIRNVIHMYISN